MNFRIYPITAAKTLLIASLILTGCASHSAEPASTAKPPALDFEAAAKRPPSAKTMYALAQILADQGRDIDAQSLLERTAHDYPEFLPAYCDLAELHMRHRQIEDAVRVLKLGLARAPKSAILVNDLGMCQLVSGDDAAALKSFTLALGVAPDEAKYRANMAAALGMLGRYDEALSLYLVILAPADAHYNMGILCQARHDANRANLEFKKAAALDQSDRDMELSGRLHDGIEGNSNPE